MIGEQLLQARQNRKWEQAAAAEKLGISQPYLSLLETGKRAITKPLARRAIKLYELPPTALPIEALPKDLPAAQEGNLASQIAALGYPKLAHVKGKSAKRNPAEVLLMALSAEDLNSRLVEALPWLAARYADLDWEQTIKIAKINDLQNRLGFVVNVARILADRVHDTERADKLRQTEETLSFSRLYREDTLCRVSMTEAERRWLKANRSAEARFWRLLTDLSPEHLDYDG
jgi:transcriptional regulator with XRE-family HTH domain